MMGIRRLGILTGAVLLAAASAAFAQGGPTTTAPAAYAAGAVTPIPAPDEPMDAPFTPPTEPIASPAQMVLPGPAAEGLGPDSPTDDVIPPVAERIFQLGQRNGFVSIRTHYDSRSIDVSWKGAIPEEVQAYADSIPYGVTVSITSDAKYSRAQGDAARQRLLEDPVARAMGVVSASVNADGSGLTLGVTLAQISDDQIATLARAAGLDNEDITINAGRDEPQGYASRQDDADPWKGGIRTIHVGLGSCSSGFAVLSGSAGRLLSARHCDPSANASVTDGDGDSIASGGSSVSAIGSIDSLLIDPSASPATTALVYTGSYTSSTTATVKNWYSNWPGDPVCASGAARGAHCGTVYDDNDTIYANGYYVGVIQASAPSGSIMAGHGDSGGPIYKAVTGGAQARGIVLGPDVDYSETFSCGTVAPWAAGTSCSRYLNYVPISTILNLWGVSLEVG